MVCRSAGTHGGRVEKREPIFGIYVNAITYENEKE
jgi:hypothetical protein